MGTTVALKDNTMEMLKVMKMETKSESFDEVIRKLVLQAKKPKQSYFGAFPGIGEFKREKKADRTFEP